MSVDLLGLAVLMAAVTYPARAIPLLVPGIERLPRPALAYLRLVGPAVLAALAAANTVLRTGSDGRAFIAPGLEWLAVGLCMGIVAWQRNLFAGLAAAVVLIAVARAAGVA